MSRIAVSTLSHHRTGKEVIHTADGDLEIAESHRFAAAGRRRTAPCNTSSASATFKEILFKNGLPWVFVFDGLDGNPDDGTVVVVGDIAPLFGGKKTTGVLVPDGSQS